MRTGGDGTAPDEAGAAIVTLGNGFERGERPQHVVPGGVWQTAEPVGDEPVLVTCVVAPGFDFQDFEMP
jgi:hypothetical protein